MGVAIGVDSHKSTLAVAVLDELGRVIGTEEFSNDGPGHGALLEWIKVHDVERVIGIEGTGNFGAAVARRLIEANEDAREVPAFLPHRERKRNPPAGNRTSVTRLQSPEWSHEESRSPRRAEWTPCVT